MSDIDLLTLSAQTERSGNPENYAYDIIADYRFCGPALLAEALCTSRRGNSKHSRLMSEGNLRLAMLGDSLLDLILRKDWYFTGQSRNEMQRWLDQQVSNSHLARIAKKHSLQSAGWPSTGEGLPEQRLADMVKALVGAVWVDSGFDLVAVKKVMHSLGLGYPSTMSAKPSVWSKRVPKLSRYVKKLCARLFGDLPPLEQAVSSVVPDRSMAAKHRSYP
jgi:ribonuclease III